MTKPPTKPRNPRASKNAVIAGPGPDPALVEHAENSAKEFLLLGVEAEEQKNWEGAIECYRRVLRINPADPETRYQALYNFAHCLYRLKRFEEATGYAHAASTAKREAHQPYNLLGVLYSSRGMYEDAAWYYVRAVQRATRSKAAWLNLRTILTKHPQLLTEVPQLAETLEAARKMLEGRGQLPKTH